MDNETRAMSPTVLPKSATERLEPTPFPFSGSGLGALPGSANAGIVETNAPARRHGHDCRDAAEPPERESGANGSVFQPSGSRKELCREHRSSSAHEGRDRRIEVAIDSRTSERIYSRETHLNMVRRSAVRNPELVNLAGGLGPIGRPPAISRTVTFSSSGVKSQTQGPIPSVVRLAAAFVVRARRGRESGWTTAQSPGVREKCGKPTPSSRFDAMSLRS